MNTQKLNRTVYKNKKTYSYKKNFSILILFENYRFLGDPVFICNSKNQVLK